MITDRQMKGRGTGPNDLWLTHSLGRGCGALMARLPGSGERASAERAFYFRYTDSGGKRATLKLGTYAERGVDGGLTVAEAMRKATELSRLYQDGVRDLREHLEAERAEREAERQRAAAARAAAEEEAARRLSVRRLFIRWQETELRARTGADGKRTGRKDDGESIRQLFEKRVFPVIGERPVEEVRKAELMEILDAARNDGRMRTANILLATLKQMFRFALVREVIDRNPLDTVTRRDAGGTEAPRDRVLSADEIRKLAAALPTANMDGPSVCAVWLILATALRISECMGARRSDIDLRARTWYVPESKGQRDHTVHLSDFAVRQIEEIERLHAIRDARRAQRSGKPEDGERSPWMFPNVRRTGHVDITTFGKQLADRQKDPTRRLKGRTAASSALALPGGRWTAHDLRRTAATMMAELGVSADVIDECLNHVIENKVRRTYIRDRRLKAQAEAFDLLGARLDELTRSVA